MRGATGRLASPALPAAICSVKSETDTRVASCCAVEQLKFVYGCNVLAMPRSTYRRSDADRSDSESESESTSSAVTVIDLLNVPPPGSPPAAVDMGASPDSMASVVGPRTSGPSHTAPTVPFDDQPCPLRRACRSDKVFCTRSSLTTHLRKRHRYFKSRWEWCTPVPSPRNSGSGGVAQHAVPLSRSRPLPCMQCRCPDPDLCRLTRYCR